ncbi:hypothetical protein HZA97_05505 [Candidatus Woesearchaeota archaeon]|nr:hypothetical protein [Candidatus Woesearchaeota archaeon]
MQINQIITESDFVNETDQDLNFLVNYLHARQKDAGFKGEYSFDIKEKVTRNKKLAYDSLIGQSSKIFKLTGGIITLDGKFDKPVSLNEVFKELSEIYRMFKVDFIHTPNKLVKVLSNYFINDFIINQVPFTNNFYHQVFSKEEDLKRKLCFEVSISCVGYFGGEELRELNNEVFNEQYGSFDEKYEYLKGIKPALEKEELSTNNGKKAWKGFEYKYYELTKKGTGVLKVQDACQWYSNFMVWYKKHNTALRCLVKSPISRKELKDHDDLKKAEELISKSYPGYVYSPLAPELKIKFQDCEILPDPLQNIKVSRVFDVEYSNKFSE